jgi:hypothetical protein
MKKVIFALAAVVALAACSKEQTIIADRGDTIGFDSFIENATRVTGKEFTTVDSFQVWGTVKGNAMNSPMSLYNGALVERNNAVDGAAFKCHQTEYWLPSAEYNFVALAGHNGVTLANDMPETISYTADGETDLIYTTDGETVTTNSQSVPEEGVNGNGCVAFTFNHLLSKVYFKFTNTSANNLCTYEISDIKIAGAKAEGTYSITDSKWTSVSGAAAALNFGTTGTTAIAQNGEATSDFARLLLPGENQTLTVTFKQKFYFNGQLMSETPDDQPITKPLTATFAPNGAYVINVNLQAGSPITFTLNKLEGWGDADPIITIK